MTAPLWQRARDRLLAFGTLVSAILLSAGGAWANGPPSMDKIAYGAMQPWPPVFATAVFLFVAGAVTVVLVLRPYGAARRAIAAWSTGSLLILCLAAYLHQRFPPRFTSFVRTTTSMEPGLENGLKDAGKSRSIESLKSLVVKPVQNTSWLEDVALELAGNDATGNESLIALLEHREPLARRIAADVLGGVRASGATDALMRRLNDKDPVVRASAARALGRMGDQKARKAIERCSSDPVRAVRYQAINALRRLTDVRSTTSPGTRMDGDSLEDRQRVVSGNVMLIDGKDCRGWLGSLNLDDPDEMWKAAQALGALKCQEAVEPLIALLRHRDSSVRTAARQALGEIGDPRAIRPLIAAMERTDGVQWAAAKALGKMGSVATKPLLKVLHWSWSWETRSRAIQALGWTHDHRAFATLQKAAQDSKREIRLAAVVALGDLGDARAVEILWAALRSRESIFRWRAVQALGRLDDPRVAECLVSRLQDDDELVRKEAATALLRSGGPTAHAALDAAAQSENLPVIAAVHPYLIEKAIPGTEDALIKTLDHYQGMSEGRPLADAFLCSGNSRLKSRAILWARRQGYLPSRNWLDMKSTVRWGVMQSHRETLGPSLPGPREQSGVSQPTGR